MLQKHHSKRGGFTLVEIMIVVAIIAILASVGIPNALRSRKRSQATQILDDLRQIDSAMDQYAIETNKRGSTVADWADVQRFIKTGTRLYSSNSSDLLGNPFTLTTVDAGPKLAQATFDALLEVAPADFWSPFNPVP